MCTGHQLTFLPKEVTLSSCNIGIRVLPHKATSWWRLFLYSHWRVHHYFLLWGEISLTLNSDLLFLPSMAEVCWVHWGKSDSTRNLLVPDIVRGGHGQLVSFTAAHNMLRGESLCFHCWLRLQNILMTKLVIFWGENRGELVTSRLERKSTSKPTKFSFKSLTESVRIAADVLFLH